MKESTRNLILITLLLSSILFTFGFIIYVEIKTTEIDHKFVKLINKQESYVDGFKDGVLYLRNSNLIRTDTTFQIDYNRLFTFIAMEKESLTNDEYYLNGYQYALLYYYENKSLIKSEDKYGIKTKGLTLIKIFTDFNDMKNKHFKSVKK